MHLSYFTRKIQINLFSSIDPFLLSFLIKFDFWLGEWDVYKYGTNQIVGRSKITSILGSYGIQEFYQAVPGPYTGTSLNKYNFFKKQWEQYWIDDSGASYFFEGSYSKKKGMVLKTEIQRNGQKSYQEMSLKDQGDGTVRQTWKQSSDKENWTNLFDGLYKKRP